MTTYRLTVAEALALPSMPCPGWTSPPVSVGEMLDLFDETDGGEWRDNLRSLAESIRREGQTTPVAIVDGELADGHHRIAALEELGAEYVLATDGQDGEWEGE